MKHASLFLLLLSSLGLSINPIVTKLLADEISFLGVLLLRFVLVALLVPVFAVMMKESTFRKLFNLELHRGFQYLILGIFFAASSLLFYYGISIMDINRALFIYFLYPVTTVILARIFIQESVSKEEGFAIFLSLIGAFMILGFDGFGTSTLLGDSMVFISMLLWSGYIVLNKYTSLRDVHYKQTLWVFLFSSVILLVAFLWVDDPGNLTKLSAGAIWLLIFIGLFGTLLPYTILNFISKHMKTSVIGLFVLLSNVFTVLLAFIIFGEQAQPNVILGGSLISIAALLSLFKFDTLFSFRNYVRFRMIQEGIISIVKIIRKR